MGKRKNRQPDLNEDASVHSSESGDEANSDGPKCPHIKKSIYQSHLRKVLKRDGIKSSCTMCTKADTNKIEVEDDDQMSQVMLQLWICLRCGNQACGRGVNQHAKNHYNTNHSDCHYLAVDTQEWTIWCYMCDAAVNADSRKQLLDIVEWMKKLPTTSYTPPRPAIPLPPIDRPDITIPSAKDKPKFLTNLTKVRGLTNLGNTCFFNSVLQCLAQTPFLVKVLENLREPDTKFVLPGGKWRASEDAEAIELPPIEGKLEGWGDFTATLWKTLTDMQSSESNHTYTPSQLLNSFKKKTSQCMDGGQHDAHELLRHLLELARNEDVRRYQKIILDKIGLVDKGSRQSVDPIRRGQLKFYGNQANARHLGSEPVFRGVLVSTLECVDCHHSSPRTEPFLDLSLPVLMDKPQPPVVGKRRNSGIDDNFDLTGNNITNVPSKNQQKKEKKAARKNRKNHHNANLNRSLSNQNNGEENNQNSHGESEESDADVEDNIENDGNTQEVIESGYSSEKVSNVASPVSASEPSDIEPTDSQTNGNIPTVQNAPAIPSSIEISSSLELNLDEASTVSPATEALPDLSPSTSVIVNSELSTGVSPLSSPMTSKESPTSPTSSSHERLCKIVINDDNADSKSNNYQAKSTFSGAETDECRSGPETEDPLKIIADKVANAKCNGVNDIASSLSKLSVGNSVPQSPTRYPVPTGECSIQSCLNQFTARELMSGSNKVGCEACTARENKGKSGKMVCTSSTKQYLVSRVPPVLILHLKRFQSLPRSGFRKVNKHVTFPMMLNLAPVCKNHDRPKVYSLYGVVVHSGTLHGGHYVACVKARQPISETDPRWAFVPKADATEVRESEGIGEPEVQDATKVQPPPGRWYHISDSRVMEIDEASVLQCEAYLLFYERIL